MSHGVQIPIYRSHGYRLSLNNVLNIANQLQIILLLYSVLSMIILIVLQRIGKNQEIERNRELCIINQYNHGVPSKETSQGFYEDAALA